MARERSHEAGPSVYFSVGLLVGLIPATRMSLAPHKKPRPTRP